MPAYRLLGNRHMAWGGKGEIWMAEMRELGLATNQESSILYSVCVNIYDEIMSVYLFVMFYVLLVL